MTSLSKKADLALSDLTSDGGLLSPEQNNKFIQDLIDSPTVLRSMRVHPMNAPTAYINKIGFGSRILHAATQDGGANDDATNDRYLAKANRAKPTTGRIELNSKEVIAEIHLPYEILEDNIEQEDLTATILSMVANRAALDLEELVIQGDTSSDDEYLALCDGVLKLATDHVYDANDSAISADVFNEAKKQIPTAYRRNQAAMRFFVHPDVEADYRLKVASRGTDLGDAVLTGSNPLPVLGSPMMGAAMMPSENLIYTNPQNLIFGIQRNIRIERDRDIRSREVLLVLTARVDVQVEEQDAIAKVTNLSDE